jgi:regulator of sigma E protease
MRRLVVIVGGPAANYLLAALLAFILVLGWGVDTGKGKGLRVVSVDVGAARAGLAEGDLVAQVNGRPVQDLRKLSQALAASDPAGNALVDVSRAGAPLQLRMPRLRGRTGSWGLGAAYTIEPDLQRIGLGAALAHAARAPFLEAGAMSVHVAEAFQSRDSTRARPLGIVGLADRVYAAKSWTARRVFALAISLSVAMGLFNLLPFPGLDGGRLCIEAVQVIARRRLPARVLIAVQVAGGLLLLAAWLWLTAFEIHSL